jgi:hypothetical protein
VTGLPSVPHQWPRIDFVDGQMSAISSPQNDDVYVLVPKPRAAAA